MEITGLISGAEYMVQIRSENYNGVSQWITVGESPPAQLTSDGPRPSGGGRESNPPGIV